MTSTSNDISALRDEKQRLAKRMREIDQLIYKKEEENRLQRIDYLIANPVEYDEDYMYVLKNYSMFYQLLLNVLGGISYQLNRNCANAIIDEMIYKYKKSQSFIGWLDTVIFNAIYDFSRKSDAEEYIYTYKHKISNFIEQKIQWDELSREDRILNQRMVGCYRYE